jgi:multiple antibiotic resistance protein
MLELGQVFTLFFVTLGPLKLLGPFMQQTRELDARAIRAIAVRAFAIGLAAVLVGGAFGTALAANWRISVSAIEIATGIIFFLVALGIVMAPYQETAPQHAQPLPSAPLAASLRLTFPLLVTPYGVAAVIAVLTVEKDRGAVAPVYALLVAIMALNLLAMLYARQIMRGIVLLILQVVGSVLGVLQVGLAVQIVIRALRELHALP